MRKLILGLALFLCFTSYAQKEEADLLVFNGVVYTVDSNFNTAEAFAVKDGKFLKVGTAKDLREQFSFSKEMDAKGKAVYPGLIDAHAHFYGLGMQQQRVDLTGTASFKEVVARIEEFQELNNTEFIVGRGWDQNDWKVKEFPVKDTLDQLFPNTPIAITRIDGHAMLVNQAALDAAEITVDTKFDGGDIEQKDGKLTGILIDNPMMLVEAITEQADVETQKKALLAAQEISFSYGLTTVDDAGLDKQVIELIDSLQQKGELKIRLYAMLSNSDKNLDYYLAKGPYKTSHLNVRSVKFYGDGALGSRGAALKEPYTDRDDHYGALLSPVSEFKATAERISKTGFQMNTHAIGDSANYMVLKTYDSLLNDSEDRRWRVEHSQVIAAEDFKYFSKNIIPSIQPTHATSDMYWAEERLGQERIKRAYAYKKLLDQAGLVALGTDFPVEQVNPFLTFYAAVDRQDTKNFPEGGFMREEALSREETLRGMTIWAAYSNFEEDEKGSIEPGKFADFVILDRDLMKVEIDKVPETKVISTFVAGEEVYKN